MAVTYTWSITNLSVYNSDEYTDAVHEATWKATGDDGSSQAEVTGVVVFGIPSNSFIPYEDLTENEVLNWVKAGLGEVRVAEAENAVYGQLAVAKYSDKLLPWNQPKAESTPEPAADPAPAAPANSQEATPTPAPAADPAPAAPANSQEETPTEGE